ncbi:MAG: hypothetical protein EG826_04060 [Deltaproteobacteria bacterium]|nr:hypothetical protein [Deltaproteobacteria bacterium]
MDILMWLIIAFVFAPMILGPFLVKFTHWVEARADIRPVAPETLDPAIRTFIDQTGTELAALGFQFAGYGVLPDYTPKVTSYFGLYRNDMNRTAAMAAVVQSAAGQSIKYCEFSIKYSNGRTIDVNNSPMSGGYRNPDKIIYRYPKISSVKKLYDICRWVTSRAKQSANPVGLVQGREMAMVAEAIDGEIRLQAKFGYYTIREGNRYKLTWWGALVMTQRQVFPFKQILSTIDLRKAEKAIAGMPR